MNGCLRGRDYDEKKLFGDCCQGHAVKDLWKDYGEELKKRERGKGEDEDEDDAPEPVPTHAA